MNISKKCALKWVLIQAIFGLAMERFLMIYWCLNKHLVKIEWEGGGIGRRINSTRWFQIENRFTGSNPVLPTMCFGCKSWVDTGRMRLNRIYFLFSRMMNPATERFFFRNLLQIRKKFCTFALKIKWRANWGGEIRNSQINHRLTSQRICF